MRKHGRMDNLPFHSQKHCTICGMSEKEIDLEAKLEAAESALAAERKGRERAEAQLYTLNAVAKDIVVIELQRKLEQAEASCAALRVVADAAREYDATCTEIFASTQPIPGYMLDVAHRSRIGLHEALERMAALSASSSAPAGDDAP